MRNAKLDEYSARIKEVFIELDHYSFFHGPSEVDRIDERFTGRTEVLERLKSLLTDHQSPAGAYLVTGFRGAGKSSLVAKALSEIGPPRWSVVPARRVLRITSPVLASTLLEAPWPISLYVVLIIAFLGLFFALVATDPKRPDLNAPRPSSRARFLRPFVLEPRLLPTSRLRSLLQDGFVIIFLTLIGQLFLNIKILPAENIFSRFLIIAMVTFVYIWVFPVARTWKLRDIGTHLTELLSSGGASRSRLQIKINLSQDNLREIDILRSIASSLETEFRKFSRPSLRRLLFRLLLLLPFLIVAHQIHQSMLLRWTHDLKRDLHIACIFPSQALYELNTVKDLPQGQSRRAAGSGEDHDIYLRALREHNESLELGAAGLRKSLNEQLHKERARHGLAERHSLLHHGPEGLIGDFFESFFLITTGIDTLLQTTYGQFRAGILVPLVQLVGFSKTDWIPAILNYSWLLFVALGWVLPIQILRFQLFDRPTHRDILNQLRDLNSMIDSEVTHEKGGTPFQASTFVSFSLGRRKRQRYRILNEREIEKRLIGILWHSQRINPLQIRPEFIVVFDELDKIQHTPIDDTTAALDPSHLKASSPAEGNGSKLGLVDVVERDRQHRILSLVSNLKHFLSTAPAKFIFIAGREMFDASLADVSDRHFFMGSVFSEVLHVPSFHSDGSDERLPDITSLPEEVLCSFLLPRDHAGRPSLAAFREYLEEHLLPYRGEEQEWLRVQRQNKVMYELHNFLTYLTYRSNGAPKRITATLERFVRRLPEGAGQDPQRLVVGRSTKSLYLSFRYPDQYTFGLVTYLASPLIFSVNRAIKDYGDKILVSSSFVLDHIFKFHGHGFSWRNLELLPDVVDINRAPQLRELIAHIMRFLARGHISEIISGLYHFKFTRRISEEIGFLSKLSEHESAAFNFTLDESLNLKRHFYRQLQHLLNTQSQYPDGWGKDHEFVNSVAFLRMILGDLHYYDGEYDSAIIEYMEAVQQLRGRNQDLRPDTLVLMIRNFLKLGLTFERKKTFDAALVTYGRIASIIADFGRENIRLSSVGSNPSSQRSVNPSSGQADRFDLDPTTIEGVRLVYQPMFARLQAVEKATLGGISQRDLIRVGQEFRMILASDQQRERFLATSEFYNKIGDILFFKNGPMPKKDAAHCHPSANRSRAMRLCFENPDREKLIRNRRRLPCSACGYYNRALYELCRRFLEIPHGQLADSYVLVLILQSFEPSDDYEDQSYHRTFSDRPNFIHELGDVLSDLGDTYTSCASAPKCRTTKHRTTKGQPPIGISPEFVRTLSELLREDDSGLEPLRSKRLEKMVELMQAEPAKPYIKIQEALAHYAVAAIVFRLASNHRAASIQIVKALWLLREYLALVRPTIGWSDECIESLATLCIRELHRSHEGTHRLEIESIKEVLEETLDGRCLDVRQVDLSRISINANITEVLVLIQEIRMLSPENTSPSRPPRALPLKDICSPYAMFPSVYSRIHALRLRSSIHFHNLRETGLNLCLAGFIPTGSEKSDSDCLTYRVWGIRQSIDTLGRLSSEIFPNLGPQEISGIDTLEMMLVDASYCNHEIIRLLQIYGRSYMASPSMKAAAHAALSQWCSYLFAYIRFSYVQKKYHRGSHYKTDIKGLQRSLEVAVGKADMVHISPNYHREMALKYWKAAGEIHSEGRAYKELLEDMYYLNDDFSDFLEHFCAALERFRLNSGFIDRRIQAMTQDLGKTSIYNPLYYFEPPLT